MTRFGPLYRPRNATRRRAGRDHAGRLEALEDLLPAPRDPVRASIDHWNALRRWAWESGGPAAEAASRLNSRLTDDVLALLCRDDVRAMYRQQGAEPASGHWQLTPEVQAEYDALMRQIRDAESELEALWRAAHEQDTRP